VGSVNKVILVGNLGRDAELRYTPGGAAVATLNLATTEVWNDKNQQRQEKTEWHRVVLWGKQAESLQEYLTKGKQIYVEGRLQTRQWDDKDGNKRYTTEIRSERILPPEERGELLEIPIEIAVSAEIRQLVDLLSRVEGSEKLLTVKDLRVRVVNVSQPRELLATLTVSGFILPSKAKA